MKYKYYRFAHKDTIYVSITRQEDVIPYKYAEFYILNGTGLEPPELINKWRVWTAEDGISFLEDIKHGYYTKNNKESDFIATEMTESELILELI